MQIKDSIKLIRKKHNLSQSQMASKLRVSRKTISSWENGRNNVNEYYIEQINKLYKSNIKTPDGNVNNSFSKHDNLFVLFIIQAIVLSFCILNLIISKFDFIIFVEIFVLLYTLMIDSYNDIKKLKKKSYFYLFIILINAFIIQIDDEYYNNFIKNSETSLAYILESILKSFIITCGFAVLTKLKNRDHPNKI